MRVCHNYSSVEPCPGGDDRGSDGGDEAGDRAAEKAGEMADAVNIERAEISW